LPSGHVTISPAENANLLSLILKAMIEEFYEKVPFPGNIHFSLNVDGQKLTISSMKEEIIIKPGIIEPESAIFYTQTTHLIEAIVEKKLLKTFIEGKIRFEGNLLTALRSYLYLKKISNLISAK